MLDYKPLLALFFIFVGTFSNAELSAKSVATELVSDDGNSRVIIGSEIEISKDEHLHEVVVVAGKVDVKGQVDRLVVIGGEAHLFSTAVISKELNSVGGYVQKEEGAKVNGRTVNVGVPLSDQSWDLIFKNFKSSKVGQLLTSKWIHFLFNSVKVCALFIFYLLGMYVAPKYQGQVSGYLQNNAPKCLLWGSISLLLVLPITMFLALSIVGLPLMPLQFSLYFLLFIYGYLHSAHLVIEFVLRKLKHQTKFNTYLTVLLGLLFFELLTFIPVVGSLLKWVAVFAGFGAASKIFYQQTIMPKAKRYV